MSSVQTPAVEPTETPTTSSPTGLFFNRFGLLVILAVLILAAWGGQTVIVVLVGLVFAAIGTARLWSYFSLQSVQFERVLSQNRVFPDEAVELKLKVINRKLLPLPWVEVHDEVPASFARSLALSPGTKPAFGSLTRSASLLWYSAVSWKFPLLCDRRGYFALGPLSVVSGDIFGFFPQTHTATEVEHLIVYPRLYPVGQIGVPSLYPLGETRSNRRIFEDPSRTIGIRDYCPGDSLRRIHWKASARQQELQVKIFEPTTTVHVAIFLAVDTFCHGGAYNEPELEVGISVAASLANYLVDKHSLTGLLANTKMADSWQPARILPGTGVGQLVTILEALAKVTPIASHPFLTFLQAERKSLPLGTTLIFVLSELSDMLGAVINDMRENGYKLLVFQIGDHPNGTTLQDVPSFHLNHPGELAVIRSGEE
jgi:uncharacterized protein (DUF58 family)